jgi:hypothetical protein
VSGVPIGTGLRIAEVHRVVLPLRTSGNMPKACRTRSSHIDSLHPGRSDDHTTSIHGYPDHLLHQPEGHADFTANSLPPRQSTLSPWTLRRNPSCSTRQLPNSQ